MGFEPREAGAVVSAEMLRRICGHEEELSRYEHDPHYDKRRQKALSRRCSACREELRLRYEEENKNKASLRLERHAENQRRHAVNLASGKTRPKGPGYSMPKNYRHWLAGIVLAGFASDVNCIEKLPKDLSESALEWADALIAKLSKKPG